MLAAIPSPSRNIIEIGPLDIRIYGIMIALGVIVAVLFIGWRMQQRGINSEIAVSLAWVVVPAGLIGARIYHVITDWKKFSEDVGWGDAVKIWEGGLGIPGAIIGGVLAGAVVCRMRGWSLAEMLDIAAPALLAAQAIGRLGNWFNQELFGRPTDLPWGLEIDREIRQTLDIRLGTNYVSEETFHPTFLYEALWMLALMGLLLWLDKLRKLPVGHLFALYVLGYASGRIWIEFLRVDPASELAGVRVNVWVMSALWLGAAAYMYIYRDKAAWPPAPKGADESDEAEIESAEAAEEPALVGASMEESASREEAMAEGRVMSARDVAAAEEGEGGHPMALTDVMVAVGEEDDAEVSSAAEPEASSAAAVSPAAASEADSGDEPEVSSEADNTATPQSSEAGMEASAAPGEAPEAPPAPENREQTSQ